MFEGSVKLVVPVNNTIMLPLYAFIQFIKNHAQILDLV